MIGAWFARPLRWGVLGTGDVLNAMAKAMRSTRGHRPHVIASRDPKRAHAAALRHGFARSCAPYEALLEDDEVDAVYVALPNHMHKEWTIRSLSAGKHVLCEKPIALSAEDVRAMFHAARENDRVLMEAFVYRFHPMIRRALQAVRDGAVGKVRRIECRFITNLDRTTANYRWDPDAGGGALWDLGCYGLHFARRLLGDEPIAFAARAVWSPSGVDERVTAEVTFPGGAKALLDCGFTGEAAAEAVVEGEAGEVVLDWPWLPEHGRRGGWIVSRGKRRRLSPGRRSSYHHALHGFARAVRRRDDDGFNAEDAEANCAALQRLYAATKAVAP